jgi:predicted secreted Zn-dependent protease
MILTPGRARRSARAATSARVEFSLILDIEPARAERRALPGHVRADVFFLSAFALLLLTAFSATAQNSVQWKTNFYRVTGATLPEIHDSLRGARPWKDNARDGLTEWSIRWDFRTVVSAESCRLASFTTATTITITLPRWVAPTNASMDATHAWQRYIGALGKHEAGHGQIAVAAASELQRRFSAVSAEASCDVLQRKISHIGNATINEFRKRDDAYDERTEHGAKDGAFLPGRSPRRR